MKILKKLIYFSFSISLFLTTDAYAGTKRISIFPLKNVNNTIRNELNFTISDTAINSLNNQNYIFNSQRSINYLKNKYSDNISLAQSLDSDIFVSGEMSYINNKYIVKCEVNNIAEKKLSNFNLENTNYFELQKLFVSELLKKLKIKTNENDLTRIKIFTKPTSNINAFYLYSLGRKELLHSNLNNYSNAYNFFRKAYNLDKDFNLAKLYEIKSNLFKIYEKRNYSFVKHIQLRPERDDLNIKSLIPIYSIFSYLDLSLNEEDKQIVKSNEISLSKILKKLNIEDTFNCIAMNNLLNFEYYNKKSFNNNISKALKINHNNNFSYFLQVLEVFYDFYLKIQDPEFVEENSDKNSDNLSFKNIDLIINNDPFFIELYNLLGIYYFQKKENSYAISNFKKSLAIDNNYLISNLNLSHVYNYKQEYILSNKYSEFFEKNNKLIEIIQANNYYNSYSDYLNKEVEKFNKKNKNELKYEDYVNLANYFILKNDFNKSITYFKLAEKFNMSEDVYSFFIERYAAFDKKEVFNILKRAIIKNPTSLHIKRLLSISYIDQRDYKKSYSLVKEYNKYYSKLIEFNDPKSHKIIQELGDSLKYVYENIINNGIKDYDILHTLSIIYKNNGEYDKQIQTLKDLLSRDKNNAILNKEIGRAFKNQKKYDLAISYLEDSYNIEPNDKSLILLLCENYDQTNKDEKAINIILKFLENPDLSKNKNYNDDILQFTYDFRVILYDYLAYFYRKQSNINKAIEIYSTAIQEFTGYESINFYNGLGEIYYSQNKFKLALDNFTKAYTINNDSDIINRNLALTYKKLGKINDSKKYLKKILTLDINNIYDFKQIMSINNYEKNQLSKSLYLQQKSRNNINSDSYNNIFIENLSLNKDIDTNNKLIESNKSQINNLNLGIYYDYIGNKDLAKLEYKKICDSGINQGCIFYEEIK